MPGVATVLLSDPDDRSRVVLASLLEALGHRVVHEPGLEQVAAAVIEPASPAARRMVRLLRSDSPVPVVCVSNRRRSAAAVRLDPVAFIAKPARVGPFVRAVTTAIERSAHSAAEPARAAA